MTLHDLAIAYDHYSDSNSFRLQRARLIQSFLAVATSRVAGRQSNAQKKSERDEE